MPVRFYTIAHLGRKVNKDDRKSKANEMSQEVQNVVMFGVWCMDAPS